MYIAPLEQARPGSGDIELRKEAAPLIVSALLLIVTAFFLRVAFGHSNRKSVAPGIAVVAGRSGAFGRLSDARRRRF